ncbi:MAG TPA: hypothetical protein VME46_02445 [Acidimicrobiales bacterium]|nr:hypothetical protein [Acidimicrobiales bacterium]
MSSGRDAPAHSRRKAGVPVVAVAGLPSGPGSASAGEGRARHFLVPAVAEPQRHAVPRWELAAVSVISLGLALALFHRDLSNLFNSQIGGAGDADEYSWFLSWVPFSLGHGLNPLVSTYVNYPGGVNLMWNTSVLLPCLVMSPVTLIFGAAFSYNILATLAPVLSSGFAHMAFRRWTNRLPSLIGALVYGFSPYVVGQSVGHLAQTLVMSAPLFLILADRTLVVQSGAPLWEGLLLGVLAWAQLLIGEEVLAMEVTCGVVTIGALCLVNWDRLALHFAYARKALAAAGGSFAVLSAPFLVFQYLGPYRVEDVHPPNAYVTDLFNFFVPTNLTQLAPAAALRVSAHFTGNGGEQDAYIGIPLVIFLFLALVLARRRPITWAALVLGLSGAILSMGPTLHVLGHVTHLDLPDDFLAKLPVLHNLLPSRFASVTTLGEGLLVALGTDELKRLKLRWSAGSLALLGAGLAAVFPTVHFPVATSPVLNEFTSGLSCPLAASQHPPGRPPVALVVPAINELDLRWQAESRFCFVMPTATGLTGTNAGDVTRTGALLALSDPALAMPLETPAARAEAAQEISDLDIREVVVAPQSPAVPSWGRPQQAQAVAWVEWLLGQAPEQGTGPYPDFVWKDLPPVGEIASGRAGTVPNA